MITRLGRLQKYTKEDKKKFDGNKPLLKYVNSYYPDKFLIKYRKFEQPKEFNLYEALEGRRIELGDRKIIFGIKAKPEEFCNYDFLWCPDGPAFVVHQRVLDIFKKECPDDFQELPIILKNLDPKGEKFENKEFWLINILRKLDIIDYFRSQSFMTIKYHDYKFRNGMRLLNVDSMKGAKICRILNVISKIAFAPELAKYFINSRGIQFLTDDEAPSALG